MSDKRVVTCNVIDGTSAVAPGAKAFVRWTTGTDRHAVLMRSRGGRYIEGWKSVDQLRDFRVKSIPPEHPLYENLTDYGEHADEIVRRLSEGARST